MQGHTLYKDIGLVLQKLLSLKIFTWKCIHKNTFAFFYPDVGHNLMNDFSLLFKT